MRWCIAVLAVVCSIAPARRARAEQDDASGAVREAKALVDRGVSEYDKGRYERAIRLFERAQRLAPSVRLLFNIGQAYAMLGQCAEALAYFRRFRREMKASGRSEPEALEARIDRMKKCAERETRPAVASPPESSPDPSEPFDATVQAKQAAAARGGRSPQRTVGWFVAGAGAAAAVTAAITGVMAINRQADLDRVCNDLGMCPEDLDDEVASYERLRMTALVSAGVGVSALAVGVWLIVTAPPEEGGAPARAASRRIRPWIGPYGLGLSGEF